MELPRCWLSLEEGVWFVLFWLGLGRAGLRLRMAEVPPVCALGRRFPPLASCTVRVLGLVDEEMWWWAVGDGE